MSESTAAKNKAIVLEAFETLFNKRDYAAAERFWSRITFSTARILLRVARACSTQRKARRRQCATRTHSSWPTAIF